MRRIALALVLCGCGGAPDPAPLAEAAPPSDGAAPPPVVPNPCVANPCEATVIDPNLNPCVEPPAPPP